MLTLDSSHFALSTVDDSVEIWLHDAGIEAALAAVRDAEPTDSDSGDVKSDDSAGDISAADLIAFPTRVGRRPKPSAKASGLGVHAIPTERDLDVDEDFM